jgi:hypothetical protein
VFNWTNLARRPDTMSLCIEYLRRRWVFCQ